MLGFEFQPHLEGTTVALSALTADRFEELQETARNLSTWKDYPNPAVQTSGSLDAWFGMGVERAKALLILDKASGRVIGTTRYYAVPNDADGIGIGYTFLDAAFRRQGQTNSEIKALMFEHAFKSVSTVRFHVLPDNQRSRAAVKKLGVTDHGVEVLTLTGKPLQYATFSRHKSRHVTGGA